MNFETSFFSISCGGSYRAYINKKNVLTVIICIELMLLSVNLNLLMSAFYLDDILGEIFVILILTVAAAETSIGLAILIVYFRLNGTIAIEFINQLKG